MIPEMVHGPVLTTDRLRLRWFEPTSLADQRFLIEMVNDPDWITHIGKRDVSTCQQAEAYLRDGPRAMCERLGFGLCMVEALDDGRPIGMCGLIKRDTLPDVDLGYALLPAERGRGYAREAAQAVRDWGHQHLGLQRIVAIVTPSNFASIRLLEHIGFAKEGSVTLPPGDETLWLLAWTASPESLAPA